MEYRVGQLVIETIRRQFLFYHCCNRCGDLKFHMLQKFRSSGVQELRSSGVQEFRSMALHKFAHMPNSTTNNNIAFKTEEL